MTSYSKAYPCDKCGVVTASLSGYCDDCASDIVGELYVVAAMRLDAGESLGAVAHEFVEAGLDRDAALGIAKSSQLALTNDEFRTQIRNMRIEDAGADDRSAGRDIVWGLILAGGGGIIAVAAYSSESSGGTYVVFGGTIAYGLIRLLQGVSRL